MMSDKKFIKLTKTLECPFCFELTHIKNAQEMGAGYLTNLKAAGKDAYRESVKCKKCGRYATVIHPIEMLEQKLTNVR